MWKVIVLIAIGLAVHVSATSEGTKSKETRDRLKSLLFRLLKDSKEKDHKEEEKRNMEKRRPYFYAKHPPYDNHSPVCSEHPEYLELLCASWFGYHNCEKLCDKFYLENGMTVCIDRLSEEECAKGVEEGLCGQFNRISAHCPDSCYKSTWGHPCQVWDYWYLSSKATESEEQSEEQSEESEEHSKEVKKGY